jgi:hypothetical protein
LLFAALIVCALAALALPLTHRPAGSRRLTLFSPLPLFAIAFTVILASRALSLGGGNEGRYFTVAGNGETRWKLATIIDRDAPERTRLAPLEDAAGDSEGKLTVTRGNASRGERAWRWTFDNERSVPFLAGGFPGPIDVSEGKPLHVKGGEAFGASIAVRIARPLARGESVEMHLRLLDSAGNRLPDQRITRATGISPNRWVALRGVGHVPPRAAHAAVLLAVRNAPAHRRQAIDVDASALVPGVTSIRELRDKVDSGHDGRWHDAYAKALLIALLMLVAILAGYLLPLGRRIADSVPAVRFVDTRHGRGLALLVALCVLGIAGWIWEMDSYGGYQAYLDALDALGEEGRGHWYQHALATLPTGVAVFLLASRMTGSRTRLAWWEWLMVGVGTAIATSYFLKATLAIPAVTVVLLLCALRPQAGWLLAAGAAIFAVVTPVIYEVRDSGKISFADLLSGEYWTQFPANLASRFFHFESLMIAAPLPASESPVRPLVDVVTTVVPRQLWEGKPDSAAARFTREHLLSGLHSPTDIGIISLPGEAWLLGGIAGIVILGLAIGVLLRTAEELFGTRADQPAALLLASALTTGLVFLNDGWGIASAAIVMAIASVGWLVLLRRAPG